MFACSRVETETVFYNPKSSFNNKKREPSPNKSTLPYNNNNNNNNNFISMMSGNDQQRVRFHEASLKRNQLKQELQRRHQLCAEKERLCREKAKNQTALKKVEECNALRKFYELKSAQLKRSGSCSSNSSSSSSSTTTTTTTATTISSSSSFSSFKHSKSIPSRSLSSTVKGFQAAYKIHSFIKHHIERKRTQRIISCLIKLRSIQNRLSLLKSINLKCSLTFDLKNKNNSEVLPISANNKAFLIYKESILKILNQVNDEFTDEFYLVRERKKLINNTVNNMLGNLDNERESQYKNFIKDIEIDDDFVIINREILHNLHNLH